MRPAMGRIKAGLQKLKVRGKLFRQYLFRWFSIAFTVATTLLTFFPYEDFGVSGVVPKLGMLAAVAVVATAVAAIETAARNSRVIWSRGNRSVKACYGDLFEISAERKGLLCVIPVNTAFDTIVDQTSSVEKPLVSPRSLHGQWVKWMQGKGAAIDSIDSQVKEGLKKTGANPSNTLRRDVKVRGNLDEYPIGTVCPIRYEGASFLLVAMSQFDDDNVAHSSRDDIYSSIRAAINYHNKAGQGCELIIPLMGTANSRAKLSHQDSFEMIVAALILNEDRMNGGATVVVYDGDADKVSIW